MTTEIHDLRACRQSRKLFCSVTVIALLVLLSACSSDRSAEDDLIFEPILAPVGLIFEYEISPDGQLAAIRLPSEAAEPGSDAYLDIVQSSVWDRQQISVFNLATGGLVGQTSATRDNITNLRWSMDSSELLYLTWSTPGSRSNVGTELIRWNVLADSASGRLFPHSGFDIAKGGSLLAAWGEDHIATRTNRIVLYSFPALEEVASYAVPGISDIEQLDWAEDNSWILVDNRSRQLRFEPVNGEVEKIVDTYLVSVFPPLLDSTGRFLLGSGTGIDLFDLRQHCVILHLEAKGRREAFAQAEWSNEPERIHLVLEESRAAQDTILSVDISEFLINEHPCLSDD
jgi:hypothetical protein